MTECCESAERYHVIAVSKCPGAKETDTFAFNLCLVSADVLQCRVDKVNHGIYALGSFSICLESVHDDKF